MEDLDPTDPSFMRPVRELEGQLHHHANDGEAEQFPKWQSRIPAEDLVRLGEKVENARKTGADAAAPAHPACGALPQNS